MGKHIKKALLLCFIISFVAVSCDQSSLVNSPQVDKTEISTPSTPQAAMSTMGIEQARQKLDPGSLKGMDALNRKLAQKGLNYRISYAETVTRFNSVKRPGKSNKFKKANGAEPAAGQIIFANDREKRLTAQWVPNGSRRAGNGNNITHIIWEPFAYANFGRPNQFYAAPAINASFETWDNLKNNPKLDIVKKPNTFLNPSSILGGVPLQADIAEVGFLPGILFELFLGSGASQSVLGVTFSFIWVDAEGNPTDINNDGYNDLAYKEVWYNDAFLWTSNRNAPGVDVETVALHENGHALGFGHFGKIFITKGNGKLHVAPKAVMNAIILGVQRDLLGTDKASYNSIYGDWPRD